MKKRELVLTGLEELWPEDEGKALFLGPWCFASNKNNYFWEHDKFELVPSPWMNKRDILKASLYIDNLYDRMLPDIAVLLNTWYKTRYNDKIWKICTVTWVTEWLNIIYERYMRLKNLSLINESLNIKIINTDNPIIIQDYLSFT